MPTDLRILIFPGILVVYGLLYLLFALKEPPEGLSRWFKIPFIFAFLPGRAKSIFGRGLTGVVLIGFAGWLYIMLA